MSLDLEKLRALCEAATPGPWVTQFHTDAPEEFWCLHALEGHIRWDRADLEFMAAARTALPALIAEVERLRRVEAAAAAYIPAKQYGETANGYSDYAEPDAFIALCNALNAADMERAALEGGKP